jgi:hypothetical protein
MRLKSVNVVFDFQYLLKYDEKYKKNDYPHHLINNIKNIIMDNYTFDFKNHEGSYTITRSNNQIFFNKMKFDDKNKLLSFNLSVPKINNSFMNEKNIFYKEIRKIGGEIHFGRLYYEKCSKDLFIIFLNKLDESPFSSIYENASNFYYVFQSEDKLNRVEIKFDTDNRSILLIISNKIHSLDSINDTMMKLNNIMALASLKV